MISIIVILILSWYLLSIIVGCLIVIATPKSKKGDEMTLQEALESLKLKFTSGNDVEVERATITREEYVAIAKALNGVKEHHLDSDISNVGC